MLRLMLLRHAKTVPREGRVDHERELTERGRADAARLGRYLAAEDLRPAGAIHSGAVRSAQTLDILLKAMGAGVAVSRNPGIYEASAATLLSIIRARGDGASPLMLVGHNPGFAETARRLAGSGDEAGLALMGAVFPTCALAILDFEIEDWSAVQWGAGRLARFITPADTASAA